VSIVAIFILTSYNHSMPPYPVPAEEIRRELTVSNSRFVASLAPVFSVDEAKAFINHIKAEFADAGEPSGTAGRPALAVLRGSSLGDVAVVITRYFGGTKLGTGGLVRAYSEAVRQVVEAVPRAEKVLTHTIMLAFPYTYLERVRMLVAAQDGTVLDEDFTADVTLTARLRVEKLPAFQAGLSELTNGKVQAEVIETQHILIPLAP
jgi:putative IMPACT (imprinted ancient) family translation regulator